MINNYVTGGNGPDTLTGTSYGDYIDGGIGADIMTGLEGDDTYVVDNAGDIVNESAGGGTDTVNSYISYSIETNSNLENIKLVGSSNVSATGNSGDNVLVGNSGNNVLSGGDGNDTYVVNNYGDSVVEGSGIGSGIDTIISTVSLGLNWFSPNVENLSLADGGAATIACGNDLDNVLTGNSVDNILNGFAGADTMIGGNGNDRYVVDNSGDIVIETGVRSMHNNDADTILTYIDYTVSDGIENLIFLNSGITATGNALDNTYTLKDATNTIVEASGGGNDTVLSAFSYTLGTNVENLTLTGNAAIDGTGNADANILKGNSGNNTLSGGDGNDTYYINSYGDSVVETNGVNSGIDTIVSSVSLGLNWYSPNVENLTLTGGATIAVGDALDNVLRGNGLANILNGQEGDDRLIGGLGNDRLWGLSGADTFVFDTGLSNARNGGLDLIGDFSSSEGDHIELSSTIFSNISGSGTLAASEFASGAGMTTSSDSAHIIYNTSSGMLYYDADASGSGGAVAFAQLGNLASLSSSDFAVA